jgi:hypothetical protein
MKGKQESLLDRVFIKKHTHAKQRVVKNVFTQMIIINIICSRVYAMMKLKEKALKLISHQHN